MLLNLSPENCAYRGEGNTGLVISLKKEEKILRLIKEDDVQTKASVRVEDQLWAHENQISMIRNVLKPLLGEHLVNCPAVVFLHKEDIKMLNNLVSLSRPSFRIHKHVKEEDTYVLLLPDYCTLPPDLSVFPSFGPVISIEIKPKQGFLIDENYLPTTVSARSLLKCHYCMMQYYKMKKKSILGKSGYCPLDLFSGCLSRMHHALKMLLQTPQNNLRIFKDQELIYSEGKIIDLEDILVDFFKDTESNSSDLLCDIVIRVLLKAFPFKTDEVISDFTQELSINCANAYPSCREDGLCHTLPVGCVLHRILNVQMLDRLSIQSLYSLYCQVKEGDGEEQISNIGCYSRSEIPANVGNLQKMEDETDYQYASRKVWEWIVALTLKDCSIMLVLKNYAGKCDPTPNQNLITDKRGNTYLFSIAIADLDAKPLSRIKKHYERMPLILQSCLSQSV